MTRRSSTSHCHTCRLSEIQLFEPRSAALIKAGRYRSPEEFPGIITCPNSSNRTALEHREGEPMTGLGSTAIIYATCIPALKHTCWQRPRELNIVSSSRSSSFRADGSQDGNQDGTSGLARRARVAFTDSRTVGCHVQQGGGRLAVIAGVRPRRMSWTKHSSSRTPIFCFLTVSSCLGEHSAIRLEINCDMAADSWRGGIRETQQENRRVPGGWASERPKESAKRQEGK